MTNEITRNVSEFNIVDRFTCEKCGISLEDYVRVIYDEETDDTTYHEYIFNYCPNCGRKVVDE